MTLQLSPHGEGYCTICRFIVGLTEAGRLERHQRGRVMTSGTFGGDDRWCPGAGRKPAPKRRVPFFSRLVQFRVKAKTARCPQCRVTVAARLDHTERYLFTRHCAPGGGLCLHSFEQVRVTDW